MSFPLLIFKLENKTFSSNSLFMKNLSFCLRMLIACWAFPSFIIYFSSLATKRIYRFPGAEIGRMIFSALFPISSLMMHSNILLTFMLTTAIHWVSISSAWARIIHLNASLNLKLYLSAMSLIISPICLPAFVLLSFLSLSPEILGSSLTPYWLLITRFIHSSEFLPNPFFSYHFYC